MGTPTIIWDATIPADSDNLSQGAERIRDTRLMIQERLINGGIELDDDTSEGGRIACGIQASNTWIVYETDKSTAAITLNDSTQMLTLGDGKDGSNQYGLTCQDVVCDDVAADSATIGSLTVSTALTLPTTAVTNPVETVDATYSSAASISAGSTVEVTRSITLATASAPVLVLATVTVSSAGAEAEVYIDIDRDNDSTYEVSDWRRMGTTSPNGVTVDHEKSITLMGVDTGNSSTGTVNYKLTIENQSGSANALSLHTYNLIVIELRA